MKSALRISLFLLVSCTLTLIIVAADDSDGFLPGHTCNEAQDCYIFDDVNKGLQLSCWYNVKQCKCRNTIRSDYHLEWNDSKCRMSKYGPCGKKGALEVDCLDGYVCKDNQCRDPENPSVENVKSAPYIFDQKCSDGCEFSEDLDLDCATGVCACRKVYIADKGDTSWDLRSYDGDRKCSVGKFGPCGKKEGLEIECHAPGTSCIEGTCVDPAQPKSLLSEGCESTKNCENGLLCSRDNNCIEPKSVGEGKRCLDAEECQEGLICSRATNPSPWNDAICHKPQGE